MKQAVISHSDTEVDADSGSRSLNNTGRGTGNRYWDAGNYSTEESERSPVEIMHKKNEGRGEETKEEAVSLEPRRAFI